VLSARVSCARAPPSVVVCSVVGVYRARAAALPLERPRWEPWLCGRVVSGRCVFDVLYINALGSGLVLFCLPVSLLAHNTPPPRPRPAQSPKAKEAVFSTRSSQSNAPGASSTSTASRRARAPTLAPSSVS